MLYETRQLLRRQLLHVFNNVLAHESVQGLVGLAQCRPNKLCSSRHATPIASEVVIEAGAAGDALVAIRQSVASINDMNIRIASAAEEQSSVADDMNRRIVTIADVAEQSASAAAETSQASAGLSELATELQTMVNRFKVA